MCPLCGLPLALLPSCYDTVSQTTNPRLRVMKSRMISGSGLDEDRDSDSSKEIETDLYTRVKAIAQKNTPEVHDLTGITTIGQKNTPGVHDLTGITAIAQKNTPEVHDLTAITPPVDKTVKSVTPLAPSYESLQSVTCSDS